MFRGITVSIINLVLIIPITLVFASHNSGAISHVASGKSTNIINVSTVPSRLAIINFDDGYKSQFINAKPILDMYGFKASFFIVCNFVGKSAKEMNSNSIVNFAGKGVEQMTWNDITTLYKQGYQIGSHTMNHLRNMTNMPNSELDYEIGHSKQCILDHGIPVTMFAYPFDNGRDNATIVSKVSQYYSYARSGNYPLMFLHCDHFRQDTQQHDCRPYLPAGKISLANRYSIVGWSHDYDRITYFYNDNQMLNRFIQVVSGQEKYNRLGQPVDAIPILVYHRIDNSRAPYSTTVSLFTEEMKYLYKNGFKVVNMADLAYNNGTNSFYLKNS
ncbi:MAG TPA: polysaccharide deacetylase family protein [Candidatus Bathyarchaeia archaeon]|nr:polysaccharide deacetylase family protein [Candidatus Bathyarchaeia archaeon]